MSENEVWTCQQQKLSQGDDFDFCGTPRIAEKTYTNAEGVAHKVPLNLLFHNMEALQGVVCGCSCFPNMARLGLFK